MVERSWELKVLSHLCLHHSLIHRDTEIFFVGLFVIGSWLNRVESYESNMNLCDLRFAI